MHKQIDIRDSDAVAIGEGASAIINQYTQHTYEGLTTEEVTSLIATLRREEQPQVWDGRIPYLGLKTFQEADAQFFFGREKIVSELLERLKTTRFLVVAGSSGSGKSSLIRAGLFHAIKMGQLNGSDKWLRATLRPSMNPIEQLAKSMARLAKSPLAATALRMHGLRNPNTLHNQIESLLSDDRSQRCVVLVDQFEELFTQTKDSVQRRAFLDLLTNAATHKDSRTTIILSMRSDFVAHCARHKRLNELLSQNFRQIGAMQPNELARAITLPALSVGAEIDPALVSQITMDMEGEAGALPLMSFALRDLFEVEKTEIDMPMDLTLPEYQHRGGLQKVLEQHAQRVFNTLDDDQIKLAHTIFSQLVEVSEKRSDTRRTVVFSELVSNTAPESAVETVVHAFADEGVRLLTTDHDQEHNERTVTLAHEKLLDSWPWLVQLVGENRETIELRNAVADDARAWVAGGRDRGELYRGAKLQRVTDALAHKELLLGKTSQAFILSSQRYRRNRRLLLFGGLAIVFLTILTSVMWVQRDQIKHTRNLLVAEETVASSLKIANAANATAEAEGTRAAVQLQALETRVAAELQASEAMRVAARATSQVQLRMADTRFLMIQARNALNTDPELGILLAQRAVQVSSANHSVPALPETKTVLAEAVAKSRMRHTLDDHTGPISHLVYSPSGRWIGSTSGDDTAKLWNSTTGNLHNAFFNQAESKCTGVGTNESGHGGNKSDKEDLLAIALHDSGEALRVAVTGKTKRIYLWEDDLDACPVILKGHRNMVWDVAFHPDGNLLASGGADGKIILWDFESKAILKILNQHTDQVTNVSFSPNGKWLVSTSVDHTVMIWDVADRSLVSVLEGHTQQVVQATFDLTSRYVISASFDKTARIWDIITGEQVALLEHGHTVENATFSSDGRRVATSGQDRAIRFWDVVWEKRDGGHSAEITTITQQEGTVLRGHTDTIWALAFHPERDELISAGKSNDIRIWSTRTDRQETVTQAHDDVIHSLAISPNGRRIATASADGTVKIWIAEMGYPIHKLIHNSAVLDVAFSPDNRHLISSDMAGTIRVWDVKTGDQVGLPIQSDNKPVYGLAFHP
ncbi:MAG: WD40 repeat domain-containing protein, partial [Candidatus Promineifilaceae bacterium]